MKKYILLAGVGFYFLTFMAIVGVAWIDIEDSPEFHMVSNVITGERVKVFKYDELTQFRELEWTQTLRYPMAKADLSEKEADRKPLYDKLSAWGLYQASLHNVSIDGDKIANAPNIYRGQEEYKATVCWHCHSQFVRPFDFEIRRWGPVAQIGEASYESPHYFATRRVGPDLLREGGLRPDDWHYAHFYNPRFTVPQSIMAPFGRISRFYVALEDARRREIEKELVESFNSDAKRAGAQDSNTAELTLMPFLADTAEEYKEEAWILFKGRSGQTPADINHVSFPVIRVAPRPTQAIIDLVAYVQSRGINIGTTGEVVQKFGAWNGGEGEGALDDTLKFFRKKGFVAGNWRQQPAAAKPTGEPDYVFAPAVSLVLQKIVEGKKLTPVEQDYMLDVDAARYRLKTWRQSIKRGADLFGKKCVGCHGGLEDNAYANERFTEYLVLSTDMEYLEPSEPAKFNLVGNGFGPAARFLVPEPRNLTLNAPTGAKGVPLQNVGYTTVFKYRSNTRDDLPMPRDLFHQIRNGMMPASMPAWPFLTDWEVWDLVNFVMYIGKNRTAREQGAKEKMSAEDIDLVAKDFYSLFAVRASFENVLSIPAVPKVDESGNPVTQVYLEKRGEELFKKKRNLKNKNGTDAGGAQCSDCHGSEGDSWGGKRMEIVNKLGFPARNFWMGQYKLGSSADDIYLTLVNGIAGTPMNAQNVNQGWVELDAWALVYYVRKMARMGVTKIEEK